MITQVKFVPTTRNCPQLQERGALDLSASSRAEGSTRRSPCRSPAGQGSTPYLRAGGGGNPGSPAPPGRSALAAHVARKSHRTSVPPGEEEADSGPGGGPPAHPSTRRLLPVGAAAKAGARRLRPHSSNNRSSRAMSVLLSARTSRAAGVGRGGAFLGRGALTSW